MLTIFYDGNCPLCASEMQSLKRHDKSNQIKLVNLHSNEFYSDYPQINFDRAMNVLHGFYQGKLLLGLAVTHRAWTLVGKGFWVAPLAWPIVKDFSHFIYLIVANYRHPISAFLAKVFGLKPEPCSAQSCSLNTENNGQPNTSSDLRKDQKTLSATTEKNK